MIIGFTGVKHSGKNQAAEFFAQELEDKYNVHNMGFAHKLKQSAAASLDYFGPEYIEFCDQLKEQGTLKLTYEDGYEWEISGRYFLQLYGTEAHRQVFGENFWVEMLMDEISARAVAYEQDLFLVTDVRFDNEAEAILKNEMGIIIKVERPSLQEGDGHASEQPIDSKLITHILDNSGSINDLHTKVKRLIRELNL